MHFRKLFVAALLYTAPFAAAQATQPTPDAWNTAADQIVAALPADGQNEPLSRLIPDEAAIQPFDSTQTETRFRLAEKLNHMTLLWQHSYTSAPPALVTDLSNGLADNAEISAALRRQLIPRDQATIAKADVTAQRWITRMLTPDASSLITVVLFWDRQPGDATSTAAREPVFVLIKGRLIGDLPAVTQIRYGQMSQALN